MLELLVGIGVFVAFLLLCAIVGKTKDIGWQLWHGRKGQPYGFGESAMVGLFIIFMVSFIGLALYGIGDEILNDGVHMRAIGNWLEGA